MMLSDRTYVDLLASGDIQVVPHPETSQVQPASLDLRLADSFVRLPRNQFDEAHRETLSQTIIRPGEFMLGSTIERIKLPSHICGQVHGKSTWARRGLMVEAAGLVDPGFEGTITLELKNLSHLPLVLSAGTPICQMSFNLLDMAVLRPYGTPGLNSHYQGQERAEGARE